MIAFGFLRKKGIYQPLLGLLILGITQCTSKGGLEEKSNLISSINLDDEINDTLNIDLFDLGKNISVIFLEETTESIVGNIYSIAANGHYIFIQTENDYFLFDRNGNFIKNPFKNGRGPGEVINPLFYSFIRDNKIWFNESNTRHYITYYNIVTEEWRRYKIPPWAVIDRIIIDSDTSFSYISRLKSSYNRKMLMDFTFIRQKTNGEILDSISFGRSSSEFLSFGLFKDPDGGILAMNPRGDSLTYIKDGHNYVIWRNKFKTIKNNSSEIQNVRGALLIHYYQDSLLLVRSNLKIIGNRVQLEQTEFVLIDRQKGKLFLLNLFVKNNTCKISTDRIFLFGDNNFCIVLSSYEIQRYIDKNEGFNLLFGQHRVSYDNNPLLIIGEFR